MNATQRNWRSAASGMLRTWYVPAALGAVVLLFIVWWLLPRRTVDVVVVDDGQRWEEPSAPLRRKIIWQPPVRVKAEPPAPVEGASVIRPQVDDEGTLRYFTVWQKDGTASIYRARQGDDGAQVGQPVDALNSPGDDIGPVLSPDGSELYLYSNRGGGYGGFDIYVAYRDGDGWSTPINLGPRINTPANEYDPAITPDGRKLYFSSNCTPRMHERAAAGAAPPDDEWTTTLRAEQGLQQFDLYMAKRTERGEPWEAPAPLRHINRPTSSEGAPYVSASGAYLYFASNRAVRPGEVLNYDLYRARIEGDQVLEIENLGPEVNTPANETEPAVSRDGFRLVFSSDRDGRPGPGGEAAPYALYKSTSIEIREEVAWRGRHVAITPAMLWWLLLALLLLALLAALAWYARAVSLRRLPVPGFFLIALLIHILLGTGSFFVYFGDQIVAQIKKDFQEIVVATHMSSDNLHQSHEAGQESYEKVADLASVETVTPTAVPRQVTEMPNVPVETRTPVFTVPAQLNREVPKPLPETVPLVETAPTEAPELARRRMTAAELAAESPVEIEQTKAAQEAAPQQPETLQVDVARRQPVTEIASLPRMRRPLDPALQLKREAVEVPRDAEPVARVPLTQPKVERMARNPAQPAESIEVKTEALRPAAAPRPEQPVERAAVEVARLQAPAPAPNAPAPLRRRPVDSRLSPAEPPVKSVAERPVKAPTARQQVAMARSVPKPDQVPAPTVETEALRAPAAAAASSPQPKQLQVAMARRADLNPVAKLPKMAVRKPARSRVSPAAFDALVEPIDSTPTRSTANGAPAALARPVQSATAEAEALQVATEEIGAPAASRAAEGQPQTADVDVARRAAPQLASLPAVMRERTTIEAQLKLASQEIAVMPVERPPAQTAADALPNLAPRAPKSAADETAASKVETEELVATIASPRSEPQPEAIELGLARRDPSGELAPPPQMLRIVTKAALARGPVPDEVPVEPERDAALPSTAVADNLPAAPRRPAPAAAETSAGHVDTEELAMVEGGPAGAAVVREAEVAVERRASLDPAAPTAPAAKVPLAARMNLAEKAAALNTADTLELATATPLGGRLALNRRTSELPATDETQIETAPAPAATAASRAVAALGLGVEVARQSGQAPAPRAPMLSPSANSDVLGSPALAPAAPMQPADAPTQPAASRIEADLALARRQTGGAEADTIVTDEPTPRPGEDANTKAPTVPGQEVAVNRAEDQLLELNVEMPAEFGGIHDRRMPELVLGSLASEARDAPLSTSPLESRILRKPARAPLLLYAEDNIGLQAMFRLRQGDAKLDVLEAFGGNEATLAAVHRGLSWIEKHQHADGHWGLHSFPSECKGHHCTGQGNAHADAAGTGFALLPFLGDGHTHITGDYQATVKKGLAWLVGHQKENGDLSANFAGNTQMYSHGIATIALCEAYAMSLDPELRDPAQRAIDFIVSAQHKPSGGWRYVPNQSADTSVVGWQVMALKSGQMAGLHVPAETLELVKKWLASAEGKGNQIGTFGYTGPSPSSAMTAEALLCMEYLGAKHDDPRLHAGAKYLLSNLPRAGAETSYYWYYGTQVMYHMQGEYWKQWNNAMRDMLVDTQIKDGPMAGTWDPHDNWEQYGGRIFASSLRLLMLEVYYRHLPLYQALQQ